LGRRRRRRRNDNNRRRRWRRDAAVVLAVRTGITLRRIQLSMPLLIF